ncbi:transposase [Micromonospora sp. KC606]|uniref:transposase n=1 Tax=Micromonospora sp. KC606 TaxID=2530379 RepID=UPI001FB676AC|nr:transposase [Micromonospora sp. KC606]
MAIDLEAVNDRITAIEETIASVVAEHELGEIVTNLPGIGITLAAEFLAHAGTLTTYSSPAALAAHAGLAPISRDSGRRQGHQVRPHRYHRGLRRVFSMSSFTALSRQRLNVLWAFIRNKTPYQPNPSRSAQLALCELP